MKKKKAALWLREMLYNIYITLDMLAAFIRLNNYRAFLFMKEDVFNNVLEKVSKATEVNVDSILRSNKEECVDARYITIAVLSERMSDRQISEVSGWSIQLVSKAKNAFRERCKFRWGLKESYKEISYLCTM